MSSTEEKLRAYRQKKEEERRRTERQEKVGYLISFRWLRDLLLPAGKDEPEVLEEDDEGAQSASEQPQGAMYWYYLCLKVLLWIVLLAIFIEFEFGSVFFVLSSIYLMYRSMGRRRRGEVSAYSVFNPGCAAIDGTLTAQQFENEIRHRNI